MRYLAININQDLDQDWYYRCASVLECYKYFESLGPGHGPRVAIYDSEQYKYIWIDEKYLGKEAQLNAIVSKSRKNIQIKF